MSPRGHHQVPHERVPRSPDGVVLSTGTCLVPPAPFSLADGDEVCVGVAEVGVLTTPVVRGLDRMRAAFERQAPPATGI
ncbi:MAG TPA: hypothetical protein VF979_07080 [Streptosporangiaceae bacterium]